MSPGDRANGADEPSVPFARPAAADAAPAAAPTTGKPKLLVQVSHAINARHHSRRTERAYVGWIRRFILFHGKRHPEQLEGHHVAAFLTHLATERAVSASTQNQALSAILLFLYKQVLGRDLPWLGDVIHAKRPERLPVVLSRQEVMLLLEQLSGKTKLVASLLYGGGLRLLECLQLRIKDIDCLKREIRVRDGKGRQDRVTVLPASIVSRSRHISSEFASSTSTTAESAPAAWRCRTPSASSIRTRPGSGPGNGRSRPVASTWTPARENAVAITTTSPPFSRFERLTNRNPPALPGDALVGQTDRPQASGSRIRVVGNVYSEIDERLRRFIEGQHVFFVATAPSGSDGHVNCSPKGLDSFAVLGPRTVAYVDFVGSGVETIAHIRQNGRIVIMFCAFEGPPKIVRLHGRATVAEVGSPGFADLLQSLPPVSQLGIRAVIRVDVTRISDSCGYGAPLLKFEGHRTQLAAWAERKGAEGLGDYKRTRNSASIDGLAGLESPAQPGVAPDGAPSRR